jgi:hypothetical protein
MSSMIAAPPPERVGDELGANGQSHAGASFDLSMARTRSATVTHPGSGGAAIMLLMSFILHGDQQADYSRFGVRATAATMNASRG